MTHETVRRLIIKAIYTDRWLFNQLVLKGGNALSLVYKVGDRSSLDLDFSIEKDFEDIDRVSTRMLNALISMFREVGIHVFDFKLEQKPKFNENPWWGGYTAEFKLITTSLADKLGFHLEDMRLQSLTIDSGSQRRKYTIEISRFEYVAEKVVKKLDDVDIYVYPPLLLAVEKLRALLQQHPDYPLIPNNTKRSRASDLYDIWVISDAFSIRLDMHLRTVEAVFNAKKVDLSLLNRLSDLRALHVASWPDVELSISSDLEDFDFYFDFVNSAARNLYAQWVENSP